MRREPRETRIVDIDGDDGGADGRRNLDAEAADTAGADPHGEVTFAKSASHHGLVRRGHGISNHRQCRQVETGPIDSRVGQVGHGTQAARRHAHVRTEPAVHVAAGKDLLRTDLAAAGQTGRALAAGQHGGHDH